MRTRKLLPIIALSLLLLAFLSQPAYADNVGLIFRGVAKTIGSVLQVPAGMAAGSQQSFPLGLVTGAVSGTMQAVAGTLSGGLDIARGAAPYAKYMLFFI